MFMYIYIYIHIYNVYIYNIYIIYIAFTTEWFFEVALESWLEWDLNQRPLNFVQTF